MWSRCLLGVGVPAGLLPVSAAVSSRGFAGGRHLAPGGDRVPVTAGVIFSIAQMSLRLLFILLRGFGMDLTIFYRGQGLLLLIEFKALRGD